MASDVLLYAVLLAAAGFVAGILAGLFGIGGGVIIVPALYGLLSLLGYTATALHVAVATSLSTIIATSVSSLNAHASEGAVDFAMLRAWTPWVGAGAAGGAVIAGALSATGLQLVFGGLGIVVAAHFMLSTAAWRLASDLPTGAPRAVIGSAIGAASAVMGVGGGAFGATLMTLYGRPIHQAVATASGFGAAIGVPAALWLIFAGWAEAGRPPLSLGYVNLPGFILIGALTTLSAPLGARLAHALPRAVLKRSFGVVFLLISGLMLSDAVLG